jgi:O-antigen/teichoic acid export membrane protein
MLQPLLIPSFLASVFGGHVGQDLVWIRTAYRCIMRATFATLLTVTSSALVLGLAGKWIIGVWAGKAAVPSSALLWSMCFWAVLLSIPVNQATLLAATQRVQFQAVYASFTAILNLVLSIVLVRRFGAIGVLSATIISYLLCVILPQTWDVRRVLRGRYLKAQMGHVEPIPEVSTYGL